MHNSCRIRRASRSTLPVDQAVAPSLSQANRPNPREPIGTCASVRNASWRWTMRYPHSMIFTTLTISILFLSTAHAEDWPKYRRDYTNTGHSAETGTLPNGVTTVNSAEHQQIVAQMEPLSGRHNLSFASHCWPFGVRTYLGWRDLQAGCGKWHYSRSPSA